MIRIQLITIGLNVLFILYISYLIVRGKLREEYAIVWIICTLFLAIFSFWRKGLDVVSRMFGVYDPPNLVFTAFIFVILIYLLHLSVVASRLHRQNKTMAQDIALLKKQSEDLIKKLDENK
jgi:hypothetical protein